MNPTTHQRTHPATHIGAAAARGIIYNLIGQGIPLLVAVIAVPPVMHGLGPARFGVLALAWILLGYFGLLDLGVSRALTKFVSHPIAAHDHAHTSRIAWTALTLQVVLGVLLALLLFLAAPLIPQFMRMHGADSQETLSVFRIVGLGLPFVLLFNATRALLEGAQRFAIVNAVRTVTGSLNFLIPLVGVALHDSLPEITAAIVVARSLAAVVQLGLCARYLQAPTYSKSEARKLLKFGGAVTVSSIVSPILVYLDRFALGRLVSMTAVGFYSAPSEIVNRVLVVPGSFALALYPLLSRSDEQAVTQSRRMVQGSLKLIWLLLAPLILLAIVYAHGLLRLWAGPELAANASNALRILLAGVLFCSFAQLPLTELHGRGRPDLPARFHVLELVVYVPLLWFCVRRWGITGAATAWSIRVTVDALLLFSAARALRDRTVPGISLRKWCEPAIMFALLAIALAGLHAMAFAGIWEMAGAILVVATWAHFTWHRHFAQEDRDLLRLVRHASY